MGGIAGLFDLRGSREIALPRLAQLADRIAWRGRDELGAWRAPGVGLTHRRAAAEGALPQSVASRDGRAAAALDGTLWNGEALRRSLAAGGARLRGLGDAELLLQGWRAWGDRLAERLDGDFAAAIWSEGRLVLIRDRWGARPLFYGRTRDGLLAFASDAGAAAAAIGAEGMRLDAAADFLRHGYFADARTLHPGVDALGPGRRLSATREGGCALQRWARPVGARAAARDPREAAAELEGLVGRAISKQAGKGRAALMLGAGVGDAALAGLAPRRATGRLIAVSLAAADPDDPALRAARRAMGAASAEHWILTRRAGDPPDAARRRLAGFAAERGAVALSGLGGAALFGDPTEGIGFWEGARALAETEGRPRAERLLALWRLRRPVVDWGQALGLFSAEARAALRGHDPDAALRRAFAEAETEDLREALRYARLAVELPGAQLAAWDAAGAAAGAAIRHPLLDREVAAFALDHRAGSAAEDLLAAATARRTGRRPVPAPRRTGRDWSEAWGALPGHALVRTSGLFDPDGVRRLVSETRRGAADHSALLGALARALTQWAPPGPAARGEEAAAVLGPAQEKAAEVSIAAE